MCFIAIVIKFQMKINEKNFKSIIKEIRVR